MKQTFHHNVADPPLYDLVINLECLSRDAATELILQGLGERFATK